MLRKK
ncbi:hypothetical protein F383_32913 [Gossypium arboreum]|jgi:hypothetical protein